MSYVITKSDGTTLTTINDGLADNLTTLTLPGPNYVGYGLALNENLVHLLENFASNTVPSALNLQGQLWFDKYNQTLKVFTTQGYLPVGGATSSGSAPLIVKDGDFWFNTNTNQFYVSNNNAWVPIGPLYTKAMGVAGAIPEIVADGQVAGQNRNIIKLQFGSTVIAIFNSAAEFVPATPIPGFPRINAGLTLNNSIPSPNFNGNVTGNVAGNVVGNISGNIVGSLGSISAINSVTVNASTITATSLSGNLVSDNTSVTNLSTTTGAITNFSTSNAQITSGNIRGLSGLVAITSILTNISTSNVLAAGASINALSANTFVTANISTGNAVITGGSLENITNQSVGLVVATNFSTGNAVISGGYLNSLSNVYTSLAQVTNFSTGNAVISGGYINAVANVYSTLSHSVNFSTGNARISGGNIVATPLWDTTLTNVSIANATTTTLPYNSNNTSVATTAFVQSVFPTGMIMMWNNSTNPIPAGWQLCNGTNGTPDLRDRFILGSGGTYPTGSTGGNESVTLGSSNMVGHNHSATSTFTGAALGTHTHGVTDPGHVHFPPDYTNILGYSGTAPWITQALPGKDGNIDGSYSAFNQDRTSFDGPTKSASTGVSIGAASAGVVSGTVTTTIGTAFGTAAPFDIRPKYYALCFIQKMF